MRNRRYRLWLGTAAILLLTLLIAGFGYNASRFNAPPGKLIFVEVVSITEFHNCMPSYNYGVPVPASAIDFLFSAGNLYIYDIGGYNPNTPTLGYAGIFVGPGFPKDVANKFETTQLEIIKALPFWYQSHWLATSSIFTLYRVHEDGSIFFSSHGKLVSLLPGELWNITIPQPYIACSGPETTYVKNHGLLDESQIHFVDDASGP